MEKTNKLSEIDYSQSIQLILEIAVMLHLIDIGPHWNVCPVGDLAKDSGGVGKAMPYEPRPAGTICGACGNKTKTGAVVHMVSKLSKRRDEANQKGTTIELAEPQRT